MSENCEDLPAGHAFPPPHCVSSRQIESLAEVIENLGRFVFSFLFSTSLQKPSVQILRLPGLAIAAARNIGYSPCLADEVLVHYLLIHRTT